MSEPYDEILARANEAEAQYAILVKQNEGFKAEIKFTKLKSESLEDQNRMLNNQNRFLQAQIEKQNVLMAKFVTALTKQGGG